MTHLQCQQTELQQVQAAVVCFRSAKLHLYKKVRLQYYRLYLKRNLLHRLRLNCFLNIYPHTFHKVYCIPFSIVKRTFGENNIPEPDFHIEPGRSIVGEAGTTLYTLGAIKDIKDVRTYISVDGGMADNIRYALYNAEYTDNT